MSRLVGLVAGLAIVVSLVQQPAWAAPSAPPSGAAASASPVPSVPGQPLPSVSNPVIPPQMPIPAAAWPAPGVAEVAIPTASSTAPGATADVDGLVRAGTLPVWVGPPAVLPPAGEASPGAAAEGTLQVPSKLRIEVVAQDKAQAAGVNGLLVKVERVDGSVDAGIAEFAVDYEAFRTAFGGAYGARLRVVEFPACVLTSPDAPGCAQGIDVVTANDAEQMRLSARISVVGEGQASQPTSTSGNPDGADPSPGTVEPPSGSVFAVMASDSSGTGTFSASPLSAQAEWSTSGAAGDFTWSYPLRVPPVASGLSPDLSVTYNSGVADGQTGQTNNQASGYGLGFDLASAYIERKYAPCRDSGRNNGDLCWKNDNAYLVLNGTATELLPKSDTEWVARSDQGWKITRQRGGDLPGRDNDDERWTVETQDGKTYTFGLSRQPATLVATSSVWTVPVYADSAGEPCWTGTFETSGCQQAWRWNLDHVSDRNGASMTYFYDEEGNWYGRNNDVWDRAYYARGGTLKSIEFGTRIYQETVAPPARLVFTKVGRCKDGVDECGAANVQNAANYPDVPTDRLCTVSQPCQNHSPTFFSINRIKKITSYVANPADPDGYQAVDAYTFSATFYGGSVEPVDPALMLTNIYRQGLVGATPLALEPGTWFQYAPMHNRIDIDTAAGFPAIIRHRLKTVYDDSAGQLDVTYTQPAACSATALPTPQTNTKNCYPAWSRQLSDGSQEFRWYHKYVVGQVVASDRTGVSPAITTKYTYNGSAAWHYDESWPIVPDQRQTWGQWRGYGSISTQTGTSSGQISYQTTTYFRGMHADRATPSGGTKTVNVSDSTGASYPDEQWLQGRVLETRVFDGPTGAEQSSTATQFWFNKTHEGGARDTYIVAPKMTTNRHSAPSLPDGKRLTRQTMEYEAYTGLLLKTVDLGEINLNGSNKPDYGESCATSEYARNAALHRVYLARATTRAGTGCAATDQLLSRSETLYDGHAGVFDEPTNGRPTRARTYTSEANYTETVMTYDLYGRPLTVTDPLNRTTTTAYNPSTLAPARYPTVTTTNSLGWTTTNTIEPMWGVTAQTTDTNGRVSAASFDAFGRITAVWDPGQSRTGPATRIYAYGVAATSPNWMQTRQLQSTAADGSNPVYVDSWAYYDGFRRLIEAQTSAPGGGRVVSVSRYDNRGKLYWEASAIYNNANPGTGLLNPSQNNVPIRSVYLHDNLGRMTHSQQVSMATLKWQTYWTFNGDRVTETPPAGAETTTISDAYGRPSLLQQNTGGANPLDTRYTYTAAGQLKTVTDPVGNVTTYGYDLLGRRTSVDDPNTGTSSTTYDTIGRAVSTTNAAGQTTYTAYDAADRPTERREDSSTGTLLADWTYDSLPAGEGLIASSTAYNNGNAYTKSISGYDVAGRPTGLSVTIPTAEGNLAGTYQFAQTYNAAGQITTFTYPGTTDLPAETVTTGYSNLGVPNTLTGVLNSVTHNYITATSFDSLGRLGTRAYGGGLPSEVQRRYTYEPDTGRLDTTSVADPSPTGDNILQQLNYAYDAIGNPLRIDEQHQPVGATATLDAAECFRYDPLNRLTTAWTTTNTTCSTEPAAGQANGVDPYHLTWTYDNAGNRLTETNKTAATPTTNTYSYPTPGSTSTRPHAPTSVTGANAATYVYDNSGRATQRSGQQNTTFAWNSNGNLATSTVVQGGTEEFTAYIYDAEGNRLLRRGPHSASLYFGAMDVTLSTTGATAGQITTTRYYTCGNAIVAVRRGAALHWMINNAQNSSQGQVQATTNPPSLATRRYLPFGDNRSAASVTNSWASELGFLNRRTESTTGLINLGAREYDPDNGMFLTPDPLVDTANPNSFNPYAYAYQNPVARADSSGLIPWDCVYDGDCYGYSPTKGCPGGCGSTANQSWGQSQGLSGSLSNVQREYPKIQARREQAAQAVICNTSGWCPGGQRPYKEPISNPNLAACEFFNVCDPGDVPSGYDPETKKNVEGNMWPTCPTSANGCATQSACDLIVFAQQCAMNSFGTLTASACVIGCGSLTYQNGRIMVAASIPGGRLTAADAVKPRLGGGITAGVNTQLPENQGNTSVFACYGDGVAVCGGIGQRGGVNADSHGISTVPASVGVGAGVGLWGGVQQTVLTIDLRPAGRRILSWF